MFTFDSIMAISTFIIATVIIIFCCMAIVWLVVDGYRRKYIYIKPISFLKMTNAGLDPCQQTDPICVNHYYSDDLDWSDGLEWIVEV